MASLAYPDIFTLIMLRRDHASKMVMVAEMKELWFTTFAENFCKRCVICNTHNVARGIKMPQMSQPPASGPFEYLMCDFVELTPCNGKKKVLFNDG